MRECKANARLFIVGIFVFGLLGGCAIEPKKLTDEEISERIDKDINFIESHGEPVTGPITLSEAMARALKYNLDYRLEWSKQVLAQTELNLAEYQLLPDLVAQTGFHHRSNFSGARSRSLLTGQESLQFSTSQDRDIFDANLELSWNVLDFGLSYYRAKQTANDVLIAEEEKRKVIHRLLQNVRTAYWRSVAAKRLQDRLEAVKDDVERALSQSEEITDRRLDTPLRSLRYRRELIDINRQIQELEENFRIARIQLASLMNIRDPSRIVVVIPEGQPVAPELELSLEEFEEQALRKRPEIRQVDYQKRNAEHAARAALLELLPVPRLAVGQYYNDNSFLFNNDWLLAGAQVSWNLLKLLSYPAIKDKAEAEKQTMDARSLTLSMAILTQVKVSMAQYLLSLKQYNTQESFLQTQSRIDEQVNAMAEANTVGRQEAIREQMNTLLAELRYSVANSNLQKAYANLLMASGLEPQIEAPKNKTLQELTDALQARWSEPSVRGVAVSSN